MRLAINAASARMGGAATYLLNVLPSLRDRVLAEGPSAALFVWAPSDPKVDRVSFRSSAAAENGGGPWGMVQRLRFDQWDLPRSLRESHVDTLFSSANFGTLRAPARQVLLVRNSLFFDPLVFARIRAPAVRLEYLAKRQLTLRSVAAADRVLFPTEAMLDLVAKYAGGRRSNWWVAPYGTRHDLFAPGAPRERPSDTVRLLNVSLYCDQKNFRTLLNAVDRLDAAARGRYRLRLTAGFRAIRPAPTHPDYEKERAVLERLSERGLVEDAPAPYASLPQTYRASDIFVFSSYTESFGHPLVEAMATGLPIVAADVPVNREMCGEAAVYFSPFDPGACADAIASVADSPALSERLRRAALERARTFTWERHLEVLWRALRD
jgi:glycosyltransferase involved in cell wall biosynthesis